MIVIIGFEEVVFEDVDRDIGDVLWDGSVVLFTENTTGGCIFGAVFSFRQWGITLHMAVFLNHETVFSMQYISFGVECLVGHCS